MDENRIVGASDSDPFQQSLRAARLQKLGQLGLADKLGNGRWRIADGIEDTLRRMGARGDIIKSEEHTPELQSLMPLPYAVFRCTYKKMPTGLSPTTVRTSR